LLGAISESTGAGAEAIPLYEQSLDHYPELDDFFWIAIRIGLCYRAMGQHDRALQYFQQSLDRGRETGDKVRIAWSHTNLGDTLVSAGAYADELPLTVAENHWREANTLFREIGTPVGIVRTNANLSSIAFFRGDLEKAQALAEEALEIATDINSAFSKRNALVKLGWVAIVEGEHSKGHEHFAEKLSAIPNSREANLGSCFAACGLGDFQGARRHIRLVLESASAWHFPALENLLLAAAAIILAYEGDKERAVELLALAFRRSASPTDLLEKWPLLTRLLAKLETELGPQAFAAAWQRGQVLAFETVLGALADRFRVKRPADAATPLIGVPTLRADQRLIEP
jgi:tetratricopeptide (TPR) repeat protein